MTQILDDYLMSRGIAPDAKYRFDLSYNSIAQAIVIPTYDSSSRLRGEMFRYLSADARPRYRWIRGNPYLFNADGVTHDSIDLVIVCEGQLDAMTVWDALGRVGEARKSPLLMQTEACGLPGASSWRREYGGLLAGKRVVVLADGDDAGRAMLASIARDLEGFVSYVMPEGLDVNDYAQMYGRLALRSLIHELADNGLPATLKPEKLRKRSSGYRGALVVPLLQDAGFDIRCSDEPGRWAAIRCPLPGHDDTHASASIAPDGTSVYCPVCRNGSGGNVFRANALRKRLELQGAA